MINIIHEIRRAKGTNKKKEILKKHKYNRDWLRFLRMTYDPHINYYVSAPREFTFRDPKEVIDYSGMFDILFKLAQRRITGNKARDVVKALSQNYGEIPRIILDGTLRAGISYTTINKVYPDLIPVFEVMLAKDAVIQKYPIYGCTKFDGVRVLARVENGEATLFTRSGKELNLISLRYEMETQLPGMYDGELVSGDGLVEGRTRITGQVNKILKGTSTDIEDYKYCVFDWVPLQDWESQKSYVSYEFRYGHISTKLKDTNHVMVAEQILLHDAKDVQAAFDGRIQNGYEGLILRYMDDPYIWARSNKLIKKKAIRECVLTCIGIKPGTHKYEGLVGSLNCMGEVNDKPVQVHVGTGLSDYDREMPFNDYIDKQIEIEYNELILAEGSTTWSLFLPRFKRVKGEI